MRAILSASLLLLPAVQATISFANTCWEQSDCLKVRFDDCYEGKRRVCLTWANNMSTCQKLYDSFYKVCTSESDSRDFFWKSNSDLCVHDIAGGADAVFGILDGTCYGPGDYQLAVDQGNTLTASCKPKKMCNSYTKDCQWSIKTPQCGSGTGDPHFTGFDGTPYYWQGMPNATFSIVSEENTAMNAYFIPVKVDGNPDATFFGQVGIVSYGDQIKITPIDWQEIVVEVNSKVIDSDMVLPSNTKIFINERNVVIDNGLFHFMLEASTYEGKNPHLNIYSSLYSIPPKPSHGVLGQSINYLASGRKLADNYPGELPEDTTEYPGQDILESLPGQPYEGYKVSSLFATDNHYSKYVGDVKQSPYVGYDHKRSEGGRPQFVGARFSSNQVFNK